MIKHSRQVEYDWISENQDADKALIKWYDRGYYLHHSFREGSGISIVMRKLDPVIPVRRRGYALGNGRTWNPVSRR